MGSDGDWQAIEDVVVDILDRRGVTPLKLGGDFSASGHRVISAKLVKNGRLDLEADEARFVDESIYKKWMRLPLLAGDVIVTSEAPLGELAYLSKDADWCLGQRLFALRPRANVIDGRFLYYALQTQAVRADLEGRASGTTVLGIRQAELRKVLVPVLSIDVQRDVGGFLGSLDDRIDNLRQTNATLEAIAQALFKSWFVDFDPVRAKVEGREPEGMDAATAALFPSDFEDSELGPIPGGWAAGTVGDITTLNASKWTSKKHPSTVRYVDLSGVTRNRIETCTEFDFDAAPSRAHNHLREGDTIVGTVRPGNRAYAYIHEPEENLTGSTGFAVLSPNTPGLSSFVYLASTSDEAIERLANLADGAAYPAVRPGVVADAPCTLPSGCVMEAFAQIATPLLEGIAKNNARAVALAALRDTLLPRLISGKLLLPDAEALLD
ncbi:restriction endonuclease subunit S [Thermomonas fusca]|uniref:Restriction endonuclease subunit S n=1 Tax=Thermomonas fusca TaxID=215690 RepID=A0A5R9PBR9_9GAMM|nr:restriction endonuclease subunit S [Thermomonas fusca]TLX20969.1 restriction endonuclease subunit S [Thermomonas fusca]